MSKEGLKFRLVQLYDSDWPQDLRDAGHHDMADDLLRLLGMIRENRDFGKFDEQRLVNLVDFMERCQSQGDGS